MSSEEDEFEKNEHEITPPLETKRKGTGNKETFKEEKKISYFKKIGNKRKKIIY